MLVVRAAEESDPIHRMIAREREAIDVIELDPILFIAPPPRLVGERARSAISREDRSPDVVRDMPRRSFVRGRRFALPGFATTPNRSFFTCPIRASTLEKVTGGLGDRMSSASEGECPRR